MDGDSTFQAFNTYFSNIYGPRWKTLLKALRSKEKNHICIGTSESSVYSIDRASHYVIELFSLHCSGQVLDMCAGHGGKSLAIWSSSKPHTLYCNEPSMNRRSRLWANLRTFIPKSLRVNRVFVTGKRGETLSKLFPSFFDTIIIDSPCSQERSRLLNIKNKHLRWSKAEVKRLQRRQGALLRSALTCLKPRGKLIYITCSLSPEENDDVIEPFVKKRKFSLLPLSQTWSAVEKTNYGWQLLPDAANGSGPLYWSSLEKSEEES